MYTIIKPLPVLIVVLPIITTLIARIIDKAKASFVIGFGTSIILFIMSILIFFQIQKINHINYNLGGWAAPLGIEYRIDKLNSLFLLLITFITSLAYIYSKPLMILDIDEKKHSNIYILSMLYIAGVVGMTVTNDLFNIYVFLEITSLCGYGLIASSNRKQCLLPAFNYLIIGTIGAIFFLIGVGLLLMKSGTLNITDFKNIFATLKYSTTVKAGIIFIILGLLIKINLFPWYNISVNNYNYSPIFVAVLLSAITSNVAIYLLIRFIYSVFYHHVIFEPQIKIILQFIAILSIIIPGLLATKKDDIKSILTLSSASNYGLILLVITLDTMIGLASGVIFTFYHSLAKTALFMAIGILPCDKYNHNPKKILRYIYTKLTIPLLSIIGIPFTAGFIGKFLMLEASANSYFWFGIAVILIGTILSIMYSYRIIQIIIRTDINDYTNYCMKGNASLYSTIPIYILCFSLVYFGFNSNELFQVIKETVWNVFAGI